MSMGENLERKAKDEGLNLKVNIIDENFNPNTPFTSYFSRWIEASFDFPRPWIEDLDDEEVYAIWYHELGHIKRMDWLISTTILSFIAISIWLVLSFFLFSGVSQMESYILLLSIFVLYFPLHLYIFHRNYFEFKADEFANERIEKEAIISGLKSCKRILDESGKLNALAHPKIEDRIKHLEEISD